MKKSAIIKILPVFPALFCFSCTTHTKSNVEDYLEILAEARNEQDFHTELYLLPDTIENLEIKAFYYASRSDLFTGSYLFYIVLGYDEASYAQEMERIESVSAHFKNGESKRPIPYPEHNLILTIKQNARFEYVIYDDANYEIAYISNQIFEWENTPVDSKYIIPDLTIPSELDDRDNMYNMYYWYEDDVGIYVDENFPIN